MHLHDEATAIRERLHLELRDLTQSIHEGAPMPSRWPFMELAESPAVGDAPHPVQVIEGGSITTPFGVEGPWQMGIHPGDDWNHPAGDYGKPIHSACSGLVVFAGSGGAPGWGDAYGIHVIVSRTKDRHRLAHCHMSARKVNVGQVVKAGQVLGLVGETGRAFGAHVHVEERVAPYRYARADVRKPTYELIP